MSPVRLDLGHLDRDKGDTETDTTSEFQGQILLIRE